MSRQRSPGAASLGLAVLLAMALCPATLQAQGLPATQVWLVGLGPSGIAGAPARISPAERYNNQPQFSPDSRLVFFTAEQEDGQTDIWQYALGTGAARPVSQSAESEYSPTPIPGQAALSVIRMEADQRQRLWRIELADGSASLLLPGIEPVGYHAWIGPDSVALFLLGETFDLHRAGIGDGASEKLRSHIGRTLRRHPHDHRLLFVDTKPAVYQVTAIDLDRNDEEPLIALFPGSEDFEVDASGNLWTGLDSKLYRSVAAEGRWQLYADLSEWGISRISRLAASPDGRWLAVVGSP